MRYLIFIIFFISIIPIVCAETTIAQMEGYWILTGELTNTNPYTVFVAVPDNITYSYKTLKSSDDFLSVNLNDNSPPINTVVVYTTVLNGKEGFWIPPYSTAEISIGGVINYSLTIDDSQNDYDISGPALVNRLEVLDLNTIFPIYKKGVKLNEFKLWVSGNISKSEDTDVLSIIVPAPVVLNDYYKFNKLLGKYDADVWIDSYNKYIDEHEQISYKQNPELYEIDDALVPIMDDDFGMDVNLKIFDVPAMAFTTESSESIDFAYTMYWDEKYN
jgi:hypothetical protein